MGRLTKVLLALGLLIGLLVVAAGEGNRAQPFAEPEPGRGHA